MAISRVKKVIEKIKKFTANREIELFRSLIAEGILDNKDEFSIYPALIKQQPAQCLLNSNIEKRY